MRYSLESNVPYYMYGGTVNSTCTINSVATVNCVNKYSLNADGTNNAMIPVATISYVATTRSWYTGCLNYGVPTWSTVSTSPFDSTLYLQSFTAPIYQNPDLGTVEGVATVTVNLAYCKDIIIT